MKRHPPHDKPLAGNIRRAEHFIGFLSRLLAHLSSKMDTPIVTSVSTPQFLAELQRDLLVDAKTLKWVVTL